MPALRALLAAGIRFEVREASKPGVPAPDYAEIVFPDDVDKRTLGAVLRELNHRLRRIEEEEWHRQRGSGPARA